MAASDYEPETSKIHLALKGASTDGERTSFRERKIHPDVRQPLGLDLRDYVKGG